MAFALTLPGLALAVVLFALDHLIFNTQLIVSELVTNAIRYAGGPVGLRLIKSHLLTCEISDPSQTQPHLGGPW